MEHITKIGRQFLEYCRLNGTSGPMFIFKSKYVTEEEKLIQSFSRLKKRYLILPNFEFTHENYSHFLPQHRCDSPKCKLQTDHICHKKKRETEGECDFLVIGDEFTVILEVKGLRFQNTNENEIVRLEGCLRKAEVQNCRMKNLIKSISPKCNVSEFTLFPYISRDHFPINSKKDDTVLFKEDLDSIETLIDIFGEPFQASKVVAEDRLLCCIVGLHCIDQRGKWNFSNQRIRSCWNAAKHEVTLQPSACLSMDLKFNLKQLYEFEDDMKEFLQLFHVKDVDDISTSTLKLEKKDSLAEHIVKLAKLLKVSHALLKNVATDLASLKSEQLRNQARLIRVQEDLNVKKSVQLKSVEKTVDEKAVKLANNEQDRERNVIMFNVQERGVNHKNEHHDRHLAIKIMQSAGLPEQDVQFDCKRIGSLESSRIRPLKVMFSSKSTAFELLQKCKNLKDDEQYSNIFIAPDRSREERAEHKRRVELLKAKRAKTRAYAWKTDISFLVIHLLIFIMLLYTLNYHMC